MIRYITALLNHLFTYLSIVLVSSQYSQMKRFTNKVIDE